MAKSKVDKIDSDYDRFIENLEKSKSKWLEAGKEIKDTTKGNVNVLEILFIHLLQEALKVCEEKHPDYNVEYKANWITGYLAAKGLFK